MEALRSNYTLKCELRTLRGGMNDGNRPEGASPSIKHSMGFDPFRRCQQGIDDIEMKEEDEVSNNFK